jgi:membrane-associated phospholipid phosphatase
VIRWAHAARAAQALVLAVAILAAGTRADEMLHDLVFRHVVSHELRLLANGFTLLGSVEVATGGLVGLAIVAARSGDAVLWQAAVGAGVGVAIGGLATQVLKHLGCRARPRLVDGWGVGPGGAGEAGARRGFFHWPCLGERGYDGFPSGHASTAFALVAGLLGRVPGWRRRLVLAAAGVGASRIILNAHFLSDVLVGGLIGWWAGQWGAGLAERHRLAPWRPVARPEPQRTPGTPAA